VKGDATLERATKGTVDGVMRIIRIEPIVATSETGAAQRAIVPNEDGRGEAARTGASAKAVNCKRGREGQVTPRNGKSPKPESTHE
jgi:hypothetical protein